MLVVAVISTFLLSIWLTWLFSRTTSRFYIIDNPNERSLHSQPLPRTGGVAILAATALGLAVALWPEISLTPPFAIVVIAFLLVAGVSFVDDMLSVPVIVRVVLQTLAAVLVYYAGFGIESIGLPGFQFQVTGWPALLVSVLFILWFTNLYNFMDGMDGFSAGMSIIGFGSLAIIGWLNGHGSFFIINLIIVSATSGFLIFNYPPARIFMGDTGSVPLGLLAAVMTLWGTHDLLFPFWVPLLVFSPFIVDATVTLIRRLIAGEIIFRPHKTHYYQKLVQLGWGHQRTVLSEYGLMLLCAASALAAVQASTRVQWLIISAWIIIYTILILMITRLEPQVEVRGE